MLTQQDFQMFSVPISNKIHALLEVIQKLNDADEILSENIYAYMPMCTDEKRQDEADNVFWNSEAMDDINEVAVSISRIRDLAKKILLSLNDDNVPTKAAS